MSLIGINATTFSLGKCQGNHGINCACANLYFSITLRIVFLQADIKKILTSQTSVSVLFIRVDNIVDVH